MSNLTGINDFSSKPGTELRIAQAAVKIYRGGAVGIVSGTGYATPLNIATAAMQFIGVSEETSDNTNGVAGTFTYGAPLTGLSPWVRVRREGLVLFAQTGTTITQAYVNEKVWFADDHTVTLTPGVILAGIIATIDESGNVWVDISNAVFPVQDGWINLTGSADAINPNMSANYIITSTGVDATTLAAPTASIDDGKTIIVSSGGAHAHTLTATGLLQTGASAVNVATFAAHPGAGLTLKAYQGVWQVLSAIGITFT